MENDPLANIEIPADAIEITERKQDKLIELHFYHQGLKTGHAALVPDVFHKFAKTAWETSQALSQNR